MVNLYSVLIAIYKDLGVLNVDTKKQAWTKLKKIEDFISQAKNTHGDKYDYTKVVYKHTDEKVAIICTIHGQFEQTPTAHLEGKGCPKCKNNGFTLRGFIKNCENNLNSEPKVYVIKCFNDNEEFIKIGLTSTTVFNRFKYSRLPYNYEIIKEIKGNPEFIYKLEKSLHNKYKDFKYKPLLTFCGETECFNINILPDFIKKVEEYSYSSTWMSLYLCWWKLQ